MQSQDFRVTTFSRSCVPIYPATCRNYCFELLFSQFKCDAEWYYVTPQWKGGLEIFWCEFSVSRFRKSITLLCNGNKNWDFRLPLLAILSYSHVSELVFSQFKSDARQYERRIEIFWVGSRPTRSEIFLIGSQPNDDIRTLSSGGVLSPNIPGLASYLTSFSVPTGRDGFLFMEL